MVRRVYIPLTFCPQLISSSSTLDFPLVVSAFTAVPGVAFFRLLTVPSASKWPCAISHSTAAFAALVLAAFLLANGRVLPPNGSGCCGIRHSQAKEVPRPKVVNVGGLTVEVVWWKSVSRAARSRLVKLIVVNNSQSGEESWEFEVD